MSGVTIGQDEVVGRKAGSDVAGLSGAEALAILFPGAPVDINSGTAEAADVIALLVTLGLANDTA